MIIVHVLEPFATGINTFIHELVSSMPEHEHIIIHGERKDNRNINEIKQEYEGKATFVKWENAQREIRLIKDFKAFLELKKTLKSIKFDVLHLHSSKAGILGRLIAFFSGYKKVVYTPNAASFLRTDISPNKRKLYAWIEKLSSKIKATVVSSSKSEYDEYKKIGINTIVIPNGVTISPYSFRKLDKNKTFNIVFCAKITTQKSPQLFNKIASQFVANPNVKFTWLGGGEQSHLLTSSNINITDWNSKKEVHDVLKESDLYLSTSSWEGLSLSTIEALAFGLPILLRNCVGNVDFIKSQEDGFLFETVQKAVDCINKLSSNTELYEKMSAQSLKNYIENYSNHKCGLAYKKIYESL